MSYWKSIDPIYTSSRLASLFENIVLSGSSDLGEAQNRKS